MITIKKRPKLEALILHLNVHSQQHRAHHIEHNEHITETCGYQIASKGFCVFGPNNMNLKICVNHKLAFVKLNLIIAQMFEPLCAITIQKGGNMENQLCVGGCVVRRKLAIWKAAGITEEFG